MTENKENFITSAQYAQKNFMAETEVIQMIKDGELVGKVHEGEWLVDIPLSRKMKREKKNVIMEDKKKFWGWAFGGGLYGGGIKGSGFGTFGVASIVAGGGNCFRQLQIVTNYDEGIRILGILAFFVILGFVLIGIGYMSYRNPNS